jgi:hypothetical protein
MLSSVRSVRADHLPGGQPDAGRVGEAALRLLDDLQHQPGRVAVAAGSVGGPGDHWTAGSEMYSAIAAMLPVCRCVMRCARQGLVTCSPDCTFEVETCSLSEVETCRSSELQIHCLPVKFSVRRPYSTIPARILTDMPATELTGLRSLLSCHFTKDM